MKPFATMLELTRFHSLADAMLMHLYDRIDPAYEEGDIEELELEDGILNIVNEEGKTIVISKHAPSTQIWLASPLSGGLHFSYDADTQEWLLGDGRNIKEVLRTDIETLTGTSIIF